MPSTLRHQLADIIKKLLPAGFGEGHTHFPQDDQAVSPRQFFLFPQTESLIKSIATNFEALMDFSAMKATWIIQIADSITD